MSEEVEKKWNESSQIKSYLKQLEGAAVNDQRNLAKYKDFPSNWADNGTLEGFFAELPSVTNVTVEPEKTDQLVGYSAVANGLTFRDLMPKNKKFRLPAWMDTAFLNQEANHYWKSEVNMNDTIKSGFKKTVQKMADHQSQALHILQAETIVGEDKENTDELRQRHFESYTGPPGRQQWVSAINAALDDNAEEETDAEAHEVDGMIIQAAQIVTVCPFSQTTIKNAGYAKCRLHHFDVDAVKEMLTKKPWLTCPVQGCNGYTETIMENRFKLTDIRTDPAHQLKINAEIKKQRKRQHQARL